MSLSLLGGYRLDWLWWKGGGLQRAAEMAQIIWQLNEYEKINLQMKILEHYFLNGDEYSLLETI